MKKLFVLIMAVVTPWMYSSVLAQTINASPNINAGCPGGDPISYSIYYSGPDVMIGVDWHVEPAGAGSISGSSSNTTTVEVTWSSSGSIIAHYALRDIGNVVRESDATKSYTMWQAGTLTAPTSVCYQGSGSLTLSGNNSGTLTWQKCTSGCSNEINWSTHSESNTFSALQVTTSFRVMVENACGTSYTNIRTVNVAPNYDGIELTVNNPFPICETSAMTNMIFTALISDVADNPQYHWYRSNNTVNDNEINTPNTNVYKPHYTLQSGEQIYCKVTYSSGCAEILSNTVVVSFTGPTEPSASINFPDPSVCQGELVTFSASSPQTITSFRWSIGGSVSLGSESTFPVEAGVDFHENDDINLYVTVEGECLSKTWVQTSTSNVTLNIYPTPVVSLEAVNGLHGCEGQTNEFLASIDNPTLGGEYIWSVLPEGTGEILNGTVTWYTLGGSTERTAKVKVSSTACGNMEVGSEVNVTVHPRPSAPPATLAFADYEPIVLKIPGWQNANNWYDANNTLLGTGYEYRMPRKPAGNYSYRAAYISEYGCISTSTGSVDVLVTSSYDEKLNYVESINYTRNAQGQSQKVAHGKTYFDFTGNPQQSQTLNLSRSSVLAGQSLNDRLGRPVLSSLAAPTLRSQFQYNHTFIGNASSSDVYQAQDFDSPATLSSPEAVGNNISGSLGWYYSANNHAESHVPVTGFPYSRTEFYDDGTGEVKLVTSPGEAHKRGSGHEVLTGTFPVFHELDDYLTKRRQSVGLADNLQVSTLTSHGTQSVVRDENGRYSVSVSDKSGHTVMSARKGTQQEHDLMVANTLTSSSDPNSADYRPLTYFYILDDQAVSVTGTAEYVIEDIVAGTAYTPPGGVWKAGLYRIVLESGAITVGYTNYFSDVSYQFYNDAGRMVSSISPNGFRQLKQGVSYTHIDKTTYQYNHRGWLLMMTEPDAGVTRFVYCKDGKIRFSENALQRNSNRFSYTHYDRLGRPVESGEYTGSTMSFRAMDDAAFAQSIMKGELEKYYDEITWDENDRKDWVITYYDDTPPVVNPLNLPQEFTRGAVVSTRNAINQTWYSYDEFGRVTWMIQKPRDLPVVPLLKYSYDFAGNVLQVENATYQSGTLVRQFFHHYEYDADFRLWRAYTSTDGTNKVLRATYEYYLHGPLKRIELGDKLQGIDFVYNINGWLTQINHPDTNQDPGKDGLTGEHAGVRKDAFGMVLDYYESSMNNLYSAAIGPATQNLNLLHGLPNERQLVSKHQPLIRFSTIEDSPRSASGIGSLRSFSADSKYVKEMIMMGHQQQGNSLEIGN